MSSSVYSLAALKKSALHFLTGKACSAALTFCLLLLLVRVLPLQDYGVFVLLHSVIELMIPLSAFGMPWVVARFVPEYRLNASGDRLYRYIRNLLLIRFGILLLILLILYFAVDAYIDYANLESYQQVVRIFVWLFFIEAMDRLVRNELLGALLMQGVAQISLVIRNLLFLIGVLFFSVGEVALTEVVIVEVVASVLGLGISICGLILSLSRLRLQQGTTDWESPKISEMFSLGKKMYLTSLVTFCYKPQALLILIQQFVSLETLAVLGFLRSLYGQIDRYLPVKLLFSIIRPKLVVSYINEGGISTLTQQANLAGKLSMFVLMPIIV
ncbi:MAG: oligosaccharide flippase family protein, partial [Nitrosomonas sp.]